MSSLFRLQSPGDAQLMTLSTCQGFCAKDVNTLVDVTLPNSTIWTSNYVTTGPLWTFSEPLFSHLLKGLSMLTHGLKWHPCQVFENSESWCLRTRGAVYMTALPWHLSVPLLPPWGMSWWWWWGQQHNRYFKGCQENMLICLCCS